MSKIVRGKMKKFHCLVLAIIIIIGVFLGINLIGESQAQDEGIVKGIFSQKIEDIEYEKIIDYGPSGVYNLDDMISKLNIEVYNEDKVEVFPDPEFGIGSKIEILRANPVLVNDAGKISTYRTWAKNVGEFIEESQIELGTNDIASMSMDERISRNMEIEITRVAMSEIAEYEEIDYEVIHKDDPTIEKGLIEIAQYPEYGEKKLTYLVRRENGEEISRELINTEMTKEPVDKIVFHGTKVVVLGKGIATWYDWISGNAAASNTLPQGSQVLVRNNANSKEVVVTIVDHGIKGGAIIDLSADAFSQIASLGAGRISVTLEKP